MVIIRRGGRERERGGEIERESKRERGLLLRGAGKVMSKHMRREAGGEEREGNNTGLGPDGDSGVKEERERAR